MGVETVTYNDIIDCINNPEVLLIDVRDPADIADTGCIPTSINIPLCKVQQELKQSRLAFLAKYQRTKPAYSQKLIFYCQFGELAQEAAEIASSSNLGFMNVSVYKAGFSEWKFKWNEFDDYVDPERLKQQERYRNF
ncbi:hypothetical protein PVAND_008641 [Polypedilum vanderplanki]|uniref:Rhodanese domain-containing protein n=1 Tax=Polypedilum vanderplanki TaxID=319348 RepID=A0A9J6CAX7_POLVA|nr:hypothetical protein PVAND_008641 [Polypedilum vanderplanki]